MDYFELNTAPLVASLTGAERFPASQDGVPSAATLNQLKAFIDSVYSLPIASNSILGGVKVGLGLTIDGGGVLAAPYEEGTFTPDIIGLTTAGTATYSARGGTYTERFGLVFFSFFTAWTAHTGTGNLGVAGLPFTAAVGAANAVACSVRHHSLTVGSGKQLIAAVIPGTATLLIRAADPAGGADAAVAMDTSVSALNISGWYKKE